eukprot:1497773-Prymnesium_polylepis.1
MNHACCGFGMCGVAQVDRLKPLPPLLDGVTAPQWGCDPAKTRGQPEQRPGHGSRDAQLRAAPGRATEIGYFDDNDEQRFGPPAPRPFAFR